MVEQRTKQLEEEQQHAERLLLELLPRYWYIYGITFLLFFTKYLHFYPERMLLKTYYE